MPGPVPQYVLFDNSALNYISGQNQHGSQLAEADRRLLVDVVRGSVVASDTVTVVNIAALSELRTQGLTAESGQAESAKQIAPTPLDREIAAGMTKSSTKTAPRMAVTTLPRGFGFVMTP